MAIGNEWFLKNILYMPKLIYLSCKESLTMFPLWYGDWRAGYLVCSWSLDIVFWINPLRPYDGLPFKPSRCIKASFYIPENRFNFPTNKGFRMKISMKLAFQYMAILLNF